MGCGLGPCISATSCWWPNCPLRASPQVKICHQKGRTHGTCHQHQEMTQKQGHVVGEAAAAHQNRPCRPAAHLAVGGERHGVRSAGRCTDNALAADGLHQRQNALIMEVAVSQLACIKRKKQAVQRGRMRLKGAIGDDGEGCRKLAAAGPLPCPNLPWRPRPQDQSCPVSLMASVWLAPAQTETTRVRMRLVIILGTHTSMGVQPPWPSSPLLARPQVYSSPLGQRVAA